MTIANGDHMVIVRDGKPDTEMMEHEFEVVSNGTLYGKDGTTLKVVMLKVIK